MLASKVFSYDAFDTSLPKEEVTPVAARVALKDAWGMEEVSSLKSHKRAGLFAERAFENTHMSRVSSESQLRRAFPHPWGLPLPPRLWKSKAKLTFTGDSRHVSIFKSPFSKETRSFMRFQ